MIQVNLQELIDRWYNYGYNGQSPSHDDRTLFKSLDGWQRKELQDAYDNGLHDTLATE